MQRCSLVLLAIAFVAVAAAARLDSTESTRASGLPASEHEHELEHSTGVDAGGRDVVSSTKAAPETDVPEEGSSTPSSNAELQRSRHYDEYKEEDRSEPYYKYGKPDYPDAKEYAAAKGKNYYQHLACKNPPPRCSKSAAPHPPPNPEDILPIDYWPWSDDDAPKETYHHEDYYYSSHKGSGYYEYPHKPYCSKRGAKYVWGPECSGKEGKTPLGGSCHGAALCQPGNAVTNAEAICTSSGWMVADGCFPDGCASAPSAILASFLSCIFPGVLEQACTGTCQDPSTGAPVATCTPAGWNITGAPCEFDACTVSPAPCDGNATCIDNASPLLNATCECNPGFEGTGLPGNCTEIDACAVTPPPCDGNATCTDNPPPFANATCECNPGFVGSGLPGSCTDFNACEAFPSPCDGNATCTDEPAPSLNATCRCNDGFVGDGQPGNCTEVNACSPGLNPCAANAICIDNNPPSTNATCVCPSNSTGDGLASGSGCTPCNGTQWSPGGNVSCSDFTLHSQYFGTSTTISQPRSLRGLAVDGLSGARQTGGSGVLYAGFIRGTDTADIVKVSASPLQFLIGNGPIPVGSNIYFSDGVIARTGGFAQGPKGVAVDDNGFLYNSDNAGNVFARDPVSSSLSLLAVSNVLAGATIEAMAFKLLNGVRYLYVCINSGLLRRLQINYASGRPSSFTEVSAIVIQPGVCRGVSVEDDGTIYYSGGTNLVAKIAPDGTQLASATVGGSWGVAHYNGKVYVAQYLSTTTTAAGSTGSGVAVLQASDLQLLATLKPPPALARIFQDTDSGYSGIAVSPTGTLYVADQIWRSFTASAANPYLPSPVNGTASNITSGAWFFDRVLTRQV